MNNWFKNYEQIAVTPQRKNLLSIAAAGLDAIETESIIRQHVTFTDHKLKIQEQIFDLTKFKNIKVIGFGKSACKAAFALEQILGNKIKTGIAIGLAPTACEVIQTFGGTHPSPSYGNVEISHSILTLSREADASDLVIVIVSGGGSALLCWPKDECDQGQILYHQFLKTFGSIQELNVVRKHISLLKGGGLAKYLFPATVIGLIFSDVPGDHYDMVASGPTYKDSTTVSDAQAIIKKYNLPEFALVETPKDDKFFEKVTNIPIVSNKLALEAMHRQAKNLGYSSEIISCELYDNVDTVISKLLAAKSDVVLAGGEPKVRVTHLETRGGRNLRSSLTALTRLEKSAAFLSLASDGLDNSDAAGAIADQITADKAHRLGLNPKKSLDADDTYSFFGKLNELIMTGPTQANVSDLMILFKS